MRSRRTCGSRRATDVSRFLRCAGKRVSPRRRSSYHERPCVLPRGSPGPSKSDPLPRGRSTLSSPCLSGSYRSAREHARTPAGPGERGPRRTRGIAQIPSRDRGQTRQQNAHAGHRAGGSSLTPRRKHPAQKTSGNRTELFSDNAEATDKKRGLPSACRGFSSGMETTESRRIKVCANCFFSVGTEAARP